MPTKIVELEYDSDDNHPGDSHKREGSNSPNFYDDDGNLVETATYRDIDEDELRERYSKHSTTSTYDEDREYEPRLTEEQAQLAEFLGELIVGVVIAASPFIKQWWCDTAMPGIKQFFFSVRDNVKSLFNKKEDDAAEIEVVETVQSLPAPSAVALAVKEAEENYSVDMTSEQAQQTILEMMALASLLARRINLLSHANITDDEYKQLESALSSESLIEGINNILLANPTMANEQTIMGLEAALSRGLFNENGEYIPIEMGEIRKLLDNPEDESNNDAVS